MKSIKKYLSAGIVLAIALFASVQVTAMRNPYENPQLTATQRDLVWSVQDDLNDMKKRAMEHLNQAEDKNDEKFFRASIERYDRKLKTCHQILFDVPSKSYTDKEIQALLL